MDLATLRKQVEAEEAAAKEAELTPDEVEAAALTARLEKAKSDKLVAMKARRALQLSELERTARAKQVGKGVLVKGIDLLSTFPFGIHPDLDAMPNAGLIVVRSPTQARYAAAAREIEAKERSMVEIAADLALEHIVVPDLKNDTEGMLARAFFEAYPGSGNSVGNEVYDLGGAKVKVDKRGHV